MSNYEVSAGRDAWRAIAAREDEWRQLLAGRSLVIEAAIDPDEAEAILRRLAFTFQKTSPPDRRMLLWRYRATFIAGVCAAAFRYDIGGFWPQLEAVMGPLAQPDQQLIADSFRRGLDSLGLSRFSFPRRNVDEILMHAGIPGQRMDEFIELLARRDRVSDGLDGRQFCQWVAGYTRDSALSHLNLDAPTFRFLSQGREIAEDLVDRCLELLDAWAFQGAAAIDVAQFPKIMQVDLLRALRELGEKQVARRSSPRLRRLDLTPRPIFDPSRGVGIRLPPLELVTESRVDWTVAAEGSVARIAVEPPWPGDPIRPTFMAVSRPAKQIAVTANPGDQTWILNLIDPGDPLVLFDAATGDWIPPRNTLPQGDVWIAVPDPDAAGVQNVIELGDGRADFQSVDSPLGWPEWQFARVALDDVSRLRRIGSESWRYVSTVSRPRFLLPDPVPMVRGRDGAAVYSSAPRILIPPAETITDGPQRAAIDWSIRMTRVDDQSVVVDHVVSAGENRSELVLENLSGEPLLGQYDIDVRGPLGRGTSQRMTIADGLETESDTDFRRMTADGSGLDSATVVVSSASGAFATSTVSLESVASRRAIDLQSAHSNARLPVDVSIPAMTVSIEMDGEPGRPTSSPVPLDLEDLSRSRLRVVVGAPGPVRIAAMRGVELLQTIESRAHGASGVATINLAQLSDTLAGSRTATLLIGLAGVRVPVARIRPRRLVDTITSDGQHFELHGLSTDEPLEIALYPRYAPWVRPTVIVTDGTDRIAIPGDVTGEAEVRAVIRVQDPWVVHEWTAEAPSRGENIADVPLGELTDDRGGADAGLRSWLKRRAGFPAREEAIPLAFSLFTGTSVDKFRTPGTELRDEIADAVSTIRRAVPSQFGRATTHRSPVDLLVRSDVVTLPPGDYSHGAELWESSPLLAVLSNSSNLLDVADDLDRVLGISALDILRVGRDPLAATGRFEPNVEVLSRWPQDRIAAVWKSANPIPSRLLDADMRMVAAKQMFDQRAGTARFDLRSAIDLVPVCARALSRTLGEAATEPIERRIGTRGWPMLPAMTIAFSLAARAEAHEIGGGVGIHTLTKPHLAELARMSPKLVEQDLILAELWLSHWSAT